MSYFALAIREERALGMSNLPNVFLNCAADALAPTSRAIVSKRFLCSSGLNGGSFFFGMQPTSDLSVSKSLVLDATQQLLSTPLVVHAKSYPSIMPEIKLCQVAMQMAFATVLISATHATLEDAEITFGRVRVDIPANIFLGTVVDSAMFREVAQLAIILQCLVGHYARLANHVSIDNRHDGCGLSVRNMDAAHLAGTLDKRQHGMLVADSWALRDALLLADESFVNFTTPLLPALPIGRENAPVRIASRMRWLMNHALLRLMPSVRCSWLELNPFLLEASK
jgi:hypothetical protein